MARLKEGKVVQMPMYLFAPQLKALDRLSEQTRIQRSALVREAVDDLLKKYKTKGGNK